MRVLVFEPKFVGHFLGFAAATANAFAKLGCEVTYAASKFAEGSDAAAVKLADSEPGVDVQFICDVPKVYKEEVNPKLEADALSVCLNRNAIDWVAAPSADFLVSGLMFDRPLRRRLRRLAGVDLVFHNPFQVYPQRGVRDLPRRCHRRLALSMTSWARQHCVDPYAISADAPGPLAYWGKPATLLPHFFNRTELPDKREACERLGLDPDAVWLGSIGDLGSRKGTEILINCFANAALAGDTRLALIGAVSATARAAIQRHSQLIESGRIVVRDGYASEQDFRNFFPAMDCIWAGYPWQVGMASTLLFAAEARRPVVAFDYGGVAWTVRKYGLGEVCERSEDAAAAVITRILEDGSRAPSEDGVQRFLELHNTTNFEAAITAGARAAMSRGADVAAVPVAEAVQ